jgi:hypothetical protein
LFIAALLWLVFVVLAALEHVSYDVWHYCYTRYRKRRAIVKKYFNQKERIMKRTKVGGDGPVKQAPSKKPTPPKKK